MYKLCKTEQSALRQRELEQHLLKKMEMVRFDEISVSDLCTQAGFSRKAFYRYFSGKEGALYALIDHTLWELGSIPFVENQTDGVTNREKLVWFFQFWQNQRKLLEALAYSGLNELLLKRMIVYTLSGQTSMADSLRSRDATEKEYVATFSISGLMSIVFLWHQSAYRKSPEQMAEISENLLTKPLVYTG